MQTLWDAEGTTRNAWALTHGMNGATILRWRDSDPSMETMEQLAQALGRPLIDVLMLAEYVTPDDAGRELPAVLGPQGVQAAIAADTAISEDGKQILLAMYRQLAGVVDEAPKPRTRRPVKVKDIRRGRS